MIFTRTNGDPGARESAVPCKSDAVRGRLNQREGAVSGQAPHVVVAMAQTAPEPLEMSGSSHAFRSTQTIRVLKSSCRRRHSRGNAGGS